MFFVYQDDAQNLFDVEIVIPDRYDDAQLIYSDAEEAGETFTFLVPASRLLDVFHKSRDDLPREFCSMIYRINCTCLLNFEALRDFLEDTDAYSLGCVKSIEIEWEGAKACESIKQLRRKCDGLQNITIHMSQSNATSRQRGKAHVHPSRRDPRDSAPIKELRKFKNLRSVQILSNDIDDLKSLEAWLSESMCKSSSH